MKTIPVSLVAAAMLLPGPCFAEPRNPERGQPAGEDDAMQAGPKRPFAGGWMKADTDGDRFISKAEFGAMPRIQRLPEEKQGNIFKRLDKDSDGKLGQDELGGMGRRQDGERPPLQRLRELDTDKSGGISFEEFKTGQLFKKLPPKKMDEVFHRLDTDGDGQLTPKDRPEPPFMRDGNRPGPGGPPREPRHLIRQFDANQDGSLSFEEFRVAPMVKELTEDEQENRFEAMDRNDDLKISAEDFPPPPPGDGPPVE